MSNSSYESKHVANFLDQFIQNALPNNKSWQLHLVKNWPDIIGNLSNHVRLEKIYGTTLILGVYDSHWMQELYLFSQILLDKINKQLEKPVVTHLKFKKVVRPKQRKTKQAHAYSAPKIALSSKEEGVLSKIEDPELQNVLKKFLIRCHTQQTLWKIKKQ